MFEMFLWWLVTFLISDYFRPRLPDVEPSGEGDFQSPTATEGRKIPQVAGGTIRMKAPNTIYQGDWDFEEVTVETGVVFKEDETVGYRYFISLALGQFMGESAGMTAIWIGDDKVFDYVTDASSIPQTVVDIDLPDLFGGERSGGGFVGRIRAFTGGPGQTVSSFLASRVPLQSAWPGLTYVVLSNLTETAGAEIGESNALRNITIEWQCYDTIANGGLGNDLSLTGDKHIIGRDANPVSVAYRILNDPLWSINTNEINFTNFQTVANTIYDEGLGFSYVVDSEQEAYKVLDEIEKHIDGYIGPNPNSGSIEIILARDDYTPATEFQATTANIKEIRDYSKPEWPQTKNEVKVRFVNRSKNYKDDHAVAQDMASRVITNRPQSVTARYPGVRDATVANKIVARVSRTYFWPVAKFELVMDRTAYALRPGNVVVVTHPDIDATNLACRITRVRTGDPIDQTIKLDCVVDVFKDETGTQAAPPVSGHVPPVTTPVLPITNFVRMNPPRWMFTLYGLEREARTLWLMARDAPNTSWELTQIRFRATAFGGNFDSITGRPPINTWTQAGTLVADGVSSPELGLDFLQDTGNAGAATASEGGEMLVEPLSSTNLGSLVGSYLPQSQFNGMAVINPGAENEEYVAFRTVTVEGSGIRCAGLYRGVETPIAQHAVGEPVYFLDTGPYMEPTLIEGDLSYGADWQYRTIATGGQSAESGWIGEIRVDDETFRKPNPVAFIIIPQLSSTVLFANGDLDASEPNSYTAPSFQGVQFNLYNRKHEQTNFIQACNAVDNLGNVYGTNSFADRNPTMNLYVYDLDQFPNPVRGNQAVTVTLTGADDRSNAVQLTQQALQDAGVGNPLNARLEFTVTNTASPGIDGVLAGVESRSTWVDKIISFAPADFTYEVAEQTLLLLHFTGETGTTKVIDYGWYNHAVALLGNLEISKAVPDDDFTGYGSPNPRASPAETFPRGHLSLTSGDTKSPATSPLQYNVCEITDGSPKVLGHPFMDEANGYMIQFRVRFTATPSGEIPIVTRWRTSDNQRAFWFGFSGTALRWKHSNDGSAELIETSVTQTLNLNQWYEFTFTVNDVYVQYFRDGAFFNSDFHTAGDIFDSSAPVRIGADGDGNTVNQNMRIDEVRITQIPLYRATWTKHQRPYLGRELQTTLLLNWENTDFAIGSPGGTAGKEYISDDLSRFPIEFPNLGSTGTHISDADSKFGTRSLRMTGVRSTSGVEYVDGVWIRDSGTPGYIDAGSYEYITNFGLRDFTCEMWVKFLTWPPAADGAALITKYWRGYVGSSPWGDFFWEFTTSGDMYFTYDGGKEGFGTYATGGQSVGSPAITTGNWYHVAMCRKDGNFSLFFDGKRIFYDTSGDAAINMDNGGGAQLALGRRFSTSSGTTRHRTWNGYMDDVRILNGTAAYDGATYTVPAAAHPVPDRENDPAPPSPTSPQGPPSPQSPQGLSPASPLPGDFFAGEEGGWEPDDL
jgi:hypothetical protein